MAIKTTALRRQLRLGLSMFSCLERFEPLKIHINIYINITVNIDIDADIDIDMRARAGVCVCRYRALENATAPSVLQLLQFSITVRSSSTLRFPLG